jgi:hypothetical protein
VAGVGDGKTPKEDTVPETPVSKRPSQIPDEWRPPPRRKESASSSDLARVGRVDPFEPGARFDVAVGGARFRTIQVRGPFALVFGLLLFLVVGAIIALVVLFAVGIGAALSIGAAAAAALGMGAAVVRRLAGRPALDARKGSSDLGVDRGKKEP